MRRPAPRSDISSGPLPAYAANCARLAVGAVALSVVLLAVVHLLNPDVDATTTFVSEYQLVRGGAGMHIVFLLLGIATAATTWAVVSQIRTRWGYFGVAQMVIATIGFALAGLFATDPATADAASPHGLLHTVGALFGGFAGGGVLFLAWSLARNTRWRHQRRRLWWLVPFPLLAQAASLRMQAIIASQPGALGYDAPIGVSNRVLVCSLAACVLVLALAVLRYAHNPTTGHRAPDQLDTQSRNG